MARHVARMAFEKVNTICAMTADRSPRDIALGDGEAGADRSRSSALTQGPIR